MLFPTQNHNSIFSISFLRYSFSEYTAAARWFIVMNYLVHSVMYSYYAFKALK